MHLVNRSGSTSLALCALLFAAPARALEPDLARPEGPALTEASASTSETEGSQRHVARSHFNRGVELAGQGEYERALKEFQVAYQGAPHFAVLYNIAQAYILLGLPLEAIETLERYRREGGEQIPPERAGRVAQQIEAQRVQTAQLRIAVNAPNAAIEIDGRPMGTAPLAQPLLVNPGTHLLTLRVPDRPPLLRSITLGAGQMLDLALELPPAPPEGAALELPSPAALPPAMQPAPLDVRDAQPVPPSETFRIMSYVLGGVGVALAGGALAHYLWNHDRYERWQAESEALGAERVLGSYVERQQANNELSRSIDSAQSVTLGLALASAACLTSGGVLFAINLSRSPGSSDIAGAHFALRGQW